MITELRESEQRLNLIFTRLFTIFPIWLVLVYMPPTYGKFGGVGTSIPLLAATSLFCTAWTMNYVPAGKTGIYPLDKVIENIKDPASEKVKGKRPVPTYAANPLGSGEGPVQRYLPVLNACLALLVLLSVYLGAGTTSGGFAKSVIGCLPALSLAMISAAKVMLGGIGVEELEGLRYGYKGA